jgi:hypothetical protein
MSLPKIKSLSEINSIIVESEESSIKKIARKSCSDSVSQHIGEISKKLGLESQSEIDSQLECEKKILKPVKPNTEKITVPEFHGLRNSFKIIPSYYMKNGNLMHIDFYEIIMDDIRNNRELNEFQLKYIEESCDENQKLEIIKLYNECYKVLISLMLD